MESSLLTLTSAIEKVSEQLEHSVLGLPLQDQRTDLLPHPSNHSMTPNKNVDGYASLGLRLEYMSTAALGNDGQPDDPQYTRISRPATLGISELSSAFSAIAFDDSLCSKLTETRRARERFFIPDAKDGDRFLESMLISPLHPPFELN